MSGDIRVLDATSGSAELVTVSGDVEVGIHAGTLTAVDLSTVSGNTDSDFEVSADAPVAEDETVDEAVFDLRVKTTSGNIRLRRATRLHPVVAHTAEALTHSQCHLRVRQEFGKAVNLSRSPS